MMLSTNEGHLKPRRDSLELTPQGESHVRFLYSQWLEAHGTQAFGEPLDHGDSEDAQGDAEVEAGVAATETVEAAAPSEPESTPLPPASVTQVLAAIKRAGKGEGWVRLMLVSVGAQDVPEGRLTMGTIQRLTPEQAVEMVKLCDAAADEPAEATA
jgi:hypothetical protein